MTDILTKTAVASLTTAEKNRRLDLVAAAYASSKNRDTMFSRIQGIEGMTDDQRRTTSTIGTLMQPAVDALNADGIATRSTLGDLEDGLGLAPDEIHDLACACHGTQMCGAWISDAIAAYKNDES